MEAAPDAEGPEAGGMRSAGRLAAVHVVSAGSKCKHRWTHKPDRWDNARSRHVVGACSLEHLLVQWPVPEIGMCSSRTNSLRAAFLR